MILILEFSSLLRSHDIRLGKRDIMYLYFESFILIFTYTYHNTIVCVMNMHYIYIWNTYE